MLEKGYRFDVVGIGEEVQADDSRQLIAVVAAQVAEIARQGGWIAANIDDVLWCHVP